MLKEKCARLFRRLKRNLRSILLVWLPAGLIAVFFAFILLSVGLSKDASFYSCTQLLTQCSGDNPSLGRMAKCAYQTAWCDITVVWDKMNGKKFPDLPGLPVVDEKADKELFEKLTSDEFLEQRFRELEEEERKNPPETGLPPKEKLKEYMEQVRRERIAFEKQQAEQRKAFAEEYNSKSNNKENNLSGKKAK